MKNIICIVLVGIVANAFGLAENALPVPLSKMDEFNARTGGLVYPPADAKKFAIIDCREKDVASLSSLVRAVEMKLALDCVVTSSKLEESDDPSKVALEMKKNGMGAVVVFYERENAPSLCVFPEDAVATVNCLALQDADEVVYRRRFVKEFWRSIGFALGAYGNSTQMGSSIQPAFSMADLDAIKGVSLSPVQINTVLGSKAKLGIYGKGAVPYTRACREGWAPAPTNNVQRAIYNQLTDPASRFKSDFK